MKNNEPEKSAKAGKSAYKSGNLPSAAEAFQAAAKGYLAAGDQLLAAEMANNNSVVLLQMGDAQAALEAVSGTPEIFAKAKDISRQAMSIGNKAAALDGLDEREEAEAAYLRSAELLNQIGEDKLEAKVIQSLSKLQLRSGRQLEALATMQSGLNKLKHPNLGQQALKKLLRIPLKFLNRS